MNSIFKAAIYVRVSTLDQHHEMQTFELRQYAERMGWDIVEYAEKASSVKKRPIFDQMMADARLRRFDVLIVWKLDRFARSLSKLVNDINLLDSYGVRFIAITQGIDTDKQNAAGRLMMQILGAIAEFERAIIVERVRAGVAQAQRDGKHCGRPKLIYRRDQARELKSQGKSIREIAAALGISKSTIGDLLKMSVEPAKSATVRKVSPNKKK